MCTTSNFYFGVVIFSRNTVYNVSYMAMTDEQQEFLEQLALRIPHLFEAIRLGNIKSEYIIGVRRIGHRHVRLKMVAEVVDAGPNPLETHGTFRPVNNPVSVPGNTPASKGRPPRTR